MGLGNDLIVFLKGDDSDFNSKIDLAKGSLAGLNNSAMAVTTKIGIAFTAIGAAVTGFMGLCLKAAGDSEKNISQLNTVLKSTGGASGMTAESATKLAESLQSVTTYTKGAVLGAENMLLTFTNIKKDVFPGATEAALNMSTALGQDLKSSSIQLGKALNDPIKGVTALSRVGVTFTQQQKDQIKTLVESGHTMEAQQLILKELSTEFGGSARAAAQTFEGKITNLKNTFMSLRATIGNAIMPMFSAMVDKIKPVIESFVAWVKSHQDLINKAAPVITVLGLISTAIGSLILILPTIISGVTALGGVLGAIFWPITIVIAVLGGLYLAWKNNFLGIQDIVKKVWDYVMGVMEKWKTYIPAITNFIVGVWTSFKNYLISIWTSLKDSFNEWYEANRDTINQFIENLKNFLVPIWEEVKASFISAWKAIKDFWDEIRPYVMQTFQVLWQFIQVTLEQLMKFWNEHWETIKNIIVAVWDAIGTVVKAAWEVVSGTIKVGLQMLSGDWSGAWDKIKSVFVNIWEGIKNAVKAGIDYIKNMWNEFTSWISNGIEKVLLKIPGAQTLQDAVGWVGDQIPAFASGGVMQHSGWAVVGESGPELVKMSAGTRVYNNNDSQKMLSGASGDTYGFQITINTTGGIDKSMVQPITEEIYKELKRKVRK